MSDPVKTADKVDGLLKKADAEEQKAHMDAMYGEMQDKMLSCVADAVAKAMNDYCARKDAEEAAEKEKSDPKDVVADEDGGGANPDQPKEGAPVEKLDSVRNIYVDSYGEPSHVAARKHRETENARRDARLSLQYEADKVYGAFMKGNCSEKAPSPPVGVPVREYAINTVMWALNKAPASKYAGCTADSFRRMDSMTFNIAKETIYADAWAVATDRTRDDGAGELRVYYTYDESGRRITNFAGETKSWISGFAGERRRLVGIRTSSD